MVQEHQLNVRIVYLSVLDGSVLKNTNTNLLFSYLLFLNFNIKTGVFGKMCTIGQIIEHKRSMKVFQGPPLGPMVECLAFLTNCHTCLEGSQTNVYFGSNPPSLETCLVGSAVSHQ